jgi:hypothetical protein
LKGSGGLYLILLKVDTGNEVCTGQGKFLGEGEVEDMVGREREREREYYRIGIKKKW